MSKDSEQRVADGEPRALATTQAAQELSKTQAERLKTLRKRCGFRTTLAASQHLGMRNSTYAAYENGYRAIRPAVAERIAKGFRSNAAWILFGDGKMVSAEWTPPATAPAVTPNRDDSLLLAEIMVLSGRRAQSLTASARELFFKGISMMMEALTKEPEDGE